MGLVRTTVLLALATALAPASRSAQLAEIPVGGEGGWDYLALDETTDWLYLWTTAGELDRCADMPL